MHEDRANALRAAATAAPKIDYNAMVAERYRALAAAGNDHLFMF
jgi:hypothetical protein